MYFRIVPSYLSFGGYLVGVCQVRAADVPAAIQGLSTNLKIVDQAHPTSSFQTVIILVPTARKTGNNKLSLSTLDASAATHVFSYMMLPHGKLKAIAMELL